MDWSIDTQKLVVVPSSICSLHKKNGGLGVKDLEQLNLALLGKLSWHLITNQAFPFSLFRSRWFTASGSLKSTPVSFSIWNSLKASFLQMKDSIKWLIGSSSALHFWTDEWI